MLSVPVILAIIVFLAWGFGDVVNLSFSRQAGARQAAFLSWLGGLVMVSLGLFGAPAWPDAGVVAASAALGLLLGWCWIGFEKALEIGKGSVVCTIAGAFVAVTLVLSMVFLGESLTAPQIAAVVVAVLGVILVSADPAEFRGGFKLDRSVALALAVMLGWGVFYTFVKLPIAAAGWYWPTLIVEVVGFLPVLWFARKEIRGAFSRRTNLKLALGTGFLVGGGTLIYDIALQAGGSAMTAAIAGSFPALTVVVIAIVFKEKLRRVQVLGVVLTLIAIVALAAGLFSLA